MAKTAGNTTSDVTQLKVLVADDDVEILSLVTQRLKSMGKFHVLEASDGEEALRIAQAEHPQLIVLDVMMPSMSGWEIARILREDDAFKQTGIIMLTGIGERLNEMTSPLYGADDYLDKPFDFKEFDQKVVQVLEKYFG